MHLVLCEQRNGKSVVARSLSPSERQAACCTSGTATREEDERDNDADVARMFENVEHPAQVLSCGKIGSDHFVLPFRLDTVFELAQQRLISACHLYARQICLAPCTASTCCSSDLSLLDVKFSLIVQDLKRPCYSAVACSMRVQHCHPDAAPASFRQGNALLCL